MPTVSGRIIFDKNRNLNISAGSEGLAQVPVVLQNISTLERLTVLTDASGNYSFIHVPNGQYRIVEVYGETGGVPTPGDFENAAVGAVPSAVIPPLSIVSNPPAAATALDCVTPNTLIITVSDADSLNNYILNGPVTYTSVQQNLDACAEIFPENLLRSADDGTFGSFAAGTPANTGPAVNPYPEIAPDFTYVTPDPTKYTPIDGQFTIQNIMNDSKSCQIGAWWRIADVTTGNETGRMMIVNGYNPGAVFFRSRVNVDPNSYYFFSSWILNLFRAVGYPPPQLGVVILGEDGTVLYSKTLGFEIPVRTSVPEWKQIGTAINSHDNTVLTVEFASEGEAAVGNDFAIDDIQLNKINIPQFVPVKKISQSTAQVGDIVTYTVTLSNTCEGTLRNNFFYDTVPDGLLFLAGSVTINGAAEAGANPNTGFALPDIPGGSMLTVAFEALVVSVPNPNPVDNTARILYHYSPIAGGIEDGYINQSNPVSLFVTQPEADLAITKVADKSEVVPGEQLTYTLDIYNNGPDTAENAQLTDNVVLQNLSGLQYSLDNGQTWHNWTGNLMLGDMAVNAIISILGRGTVTSAPGSVVVNTAVVSSDTTDPNLDNNTATVTVPVINAETFADLAVTKTAGQQEVVPGDVLTYTLEIYNYGPDPAENALLTDTVVLENLSGLEYSVDGGQTWSSWTGTLALGDMATGASRTILGRGTVVSTPGSVVVNTAVVSSDTTDPDLSNNSSTVTVPVIQGETLADLAITKVADKQQVVPGDLLVYTLNIQNNGPDTAENALLTDYVVLENLSNLQFSVDGGQTWNNWTGTLALGDMAVNAAVNVLGRGTVISAPGSVIVNTAVVSSDTTDPVPENNSATVEVPVLQGETFADLAITKTADRQEVMPGDSLAYTLNIYNYGPDTAENAQLTDQVVLENLIDLQYSLDGGQTWYNWTGMLALGDMAANTSMTILGRGIVNAAPGSMVVNTAVVSSDTTDPVPENNSATVIIPVLPVELVADLAITKTADKEAVTPGDVLTYTLNILNYGPDTAVNAQLTDHVVLENLGFLEYSWDGGQTWQSWTGNLALGDMAANTSLTILGRGTVLSMPGSVVANTAVVSSDSTDPNPNNNIAIVIVPVVPAETLADLAVTKAADKAVVAPGETLTYTLVIHNYGPDTAENTQLTDNTVLEYLNETQYSLDGGQTWQIWTGSLALGDMTINSTVTVLLRGIVPVTAAGLIANTATGESETPDPNPDNNTASTTTPVWNCQCCPCCRCCQPCCCCKCKKCIGSAPPGCV